LVEEKINVVEEKVNAIEKDTIVRDNETICEEGDKFSKAAREPEQAAVKEDEDPRGKHKQYEDTKKNKNYGSKTGYNTCNSCGDNYRNMMKKTLEYIMVEFAEMESHNDLIDCKMWKVDMESCRHHGHKVYMYPMYDLIFYPMMCSNYLNYFHYIRKHGHYLFGIKYDKHKEVEALIFAIPGRNKPIDQPFNGSTGFLKWIPWGSSGDGYWVMMYDPMTGKVSISKK
jgi:hypothetical protein